MQKENCEGVIILFSLSRAILWTISSWNFILEKDKRAFTKSSQLYQVQTVKLLHSFINPFAFKMLGFISFKTTIN